MCLVLRVPTHAHTHARIQTHAVVKLAARGYTHVGGTRVCAQMSASGRSLDVGSRIYVWERKIIHHVRGHPELAVVDGRCFGHRFSMDARVIKLMSVFD